MHLLTSLLVLILYFSSLEGFEKVVIWGHKLHSHTHSYIHKGFYDAFSHLGYPTYWLDNQDNIEDVDFSNALFLTEGQVDQKIPLREDGIYILHNCHLEKYKRLKMMALQVYTDHVLSIRDAVQVAPFIYFHIMGKCLYMPWATNLLPYQIEKVKQQLPKIQKQNNVYWIGTIGDGRFGNRQQLQPFISACQENDIPFICPNPCATGTSDKQHQMLIMSAYLAPAIVGEWQQEVGYIPCRIFKNISYGQIGVTNSRRAYELFQRKIVYNPDCYQLFYDAREHLRKTTLEDIYELMDFVKTQHTYINRVHTLLDFLKLLGYLDETDRLIPSHSSFGNNLDFYRDWLEKGTYEGQDWPSLPRLPKSRYDTFQFAFQHMKNIGGKLIVELGTTRSFRHGGLEGCNSDDISYWNPTAPQNWDWGAGFFTLMAAISLSDLSPQIHTVDLTASHIKRCKVITQNYSHMITYHVNNSLNFLKECHFPEGIDLLYLDTGDMTPIEPSALLQLEEAKIIIQRNLISDHGLILIDDVKNCTPRKFGDLSNLGKSKYSLPFLLNNGFEIVMDEYQVILRKHKS